MENCDLLHQFEEAERTAVSLSKDRSSLTTQLEDAKRLADAETRERINLLGKMRYKSSSIYPFLNLYFNLYTGTYSMSWR